MTYKIVFFYNGKKTKHKLYDSEKSFEQYWKYHKDFIENYGFGHEGIAGLKDGKVIRMYGNAVIKE